MSLLGFQQALSELVLSAELRSRVADRGSAALNAFDLDPKEQRRVLAIAEQSGLKTGILIHRSFRLSMLVRSLPRTCRLLGEELSDLVHEFWQEHLPLHYNFVWESGRFANFLRERQRTDALAEPLLLDVLRLDLATMALQRGLTPEAVGLDPRPGGDDLATAPSHDRFVLVCEHDPMVLLADPDSDRELPANAPGAEFRLAICRRSDGSLEVEPV